MIYVTSSKTPRIDVVKALETECGMQDFEGKSALMRAITRKNLPVDIIKFLSKKESLLVDNEGRTALSYSEPQYIPYLTKEIGKLDKNGSTSLMH